MKQRLWVLAAVTTILLTGTSARAEVFSPGQLILGNEGIPAAVECQAEADDWPTIRTLDSLTSTAGPVLVIPGNTVVAEEATSGVLALRSGDYFVVAQQERPGEVYPLRLSVLRQGDLYRTSDGRMNVAPEREHLPLVKDSGASVPTLPDGNLETILPRAAQTLFMRQIPRVVIGVEDGWFYELRRDEKSAFFARPEEVPGRLTAINLLLDRREAAK